MVLFLPHRHKASIHGHCTSYITPGAPQMIQVEWSRRSTEAFTEAGIEVALVLRCISCLLQEFWSIVDVANYLKFIILCYYPI